MISMSLLDVSMINGYIRKVCSDIILSSFSDRVYVAGSINYSQFTDKNTSQQVHATSIIAGRYYLLAHKNTSQQVHATSIIAGRYHLLAQLVSHRIDQVVRVMTFVHFCCSPLQNLSLSGVDRHDCLSPGFSVLCELSIELVLFQIAPHSVHPPQSGPSSRSSSSSRLHRCYFLCRICVVSSHHTPRKAFLGDICGVWLDHCIAPELFISDSGFPVTS